MPFQLQALWFGMSIEVRSFRKDMLPKVHQDLDFNKNDLPLDLEIGCGVGLHPIKYSKENTNRFLIAVEHTKEKFEKFARRIENNDIKDNLLPVHANAVSWVTQVLKSESLDKVFLLYPNPNPKNLQKRWHAMPFMHELLSKLKENGTIELSTNEEFYYLEAKEYFLEFWNLELVCDQKYNGPHRTHFEKKYLERDDACYQLIFKKTT